MYTVSDKDLAPPIVPKDERKKEEPEKEEEMPPRGCGGLPKSNLIWEADR